MKKLLSILGAVGMVATTGATVVACGNSDQVKEPLTKESLENLLKDGVTLEVPQGIKKGVENKDDDLSLTQMLIQSVNDSIQKAKLDGSIDKLEWKNAESALPNQDQLDSALVDLANENSTNIWVSQEKNETSFTLSNGETFDLQFDYKIKIIPALKENIDHFAANAHLVIPKDKVTTDDKGLITSVDLTDEEWTKLLWTKFMDARHDDKGLAWYEEAKIGNILHSEGASAVLTKKLTDREAKVNDEYGIFFTENELKLILDEDVLTYRKNMDNSLGRGLITKGETSFVNLSIGIY